MTKLSIVAPAQAQHHDCCLTSVAGEGVAPAQARWRCDEAQRNDDDENVGQRRVGALRRIIAVSIIIYVNINVNIDINVIVIVIVIISLICVVARSNLVSLAMVM